MTFTSGFSNGAHSLRMDESAVRLLFVEHSPEYAALVCETLQQAPTGHFEVQHADRLDLAARTIEDGDYDAVLLDLTENSADGSDTIEAAALIASRLPVIVLTGAASEATPQGVEAEKDAHDEARVRDKIAESDLPGAILSAVRRSRRLGQTGASEPIVLRDPLRALARAFAKLRTLAG
jgi:CheY-like chemotaxis protein